jgi:tetratricopeptide (TPR) repeat protein
MRKLLYFLCLAIFIIGCNKKNQTSNTVQEESGDQTELMQTYDRADSLYQQGIINQELFEEFIDQAIRFADVHPENEIIPDMLSKAGVACMILAKSKSMEQNPDEEYIENYARKGISIFEKIQATYPDYEGVKNCYLNRAFIYDDILHKYLDAEYEYREFLHKYPEDSACENIRAYLQVLGKSEEEIMAAINN